MAWEDPITTTEAGSNWNEPTPQKKQKYSQDELVGIASEAAKKHGADIPHFEPVFLALGKQESGFTHDATSPTGVKGLYQVTLDTGRDYKPDLTDEERTNPHISADLGARHLRELYKDKGNWPDAIFAYNGGSDPKFRENVGRHLDWARGQISKRNTPSPDAGWADPVPSEAPTFEAGAAVTAKATKQPQPGTPAAEVTKLMTRPKSELSWSAGHGMAGPDQAPLLAALQGDEAPAAEPTAGLKLGRNQDIPPGEEERLMSISRAGGPNYEAQLSGLPQGIAPGNIPGRMQVPLMPELSEGGMGDIVRRQMVEGRLPEETKQFLAGDQRPINPQEVAAALKETGAKLTLDRPGLPKDEFGVPPIPAGMLFTRASDKKQVPFEELHPMEQAEINQRLIPQQLVKGLMEGITFNAKEGGAVPLGMENFRKAGQFGGYGALLTVATAFTSTGIGALFPAAVAAGTAPYAATGLAAGLLGAANKAVEQAKKGQPASWEGLAEMADQATQEAANMMAIHAGISGAAAALPVLNMGSRLILNDLRNSFYKNAPESLLRNIPGYKGGLPVAEPPMEAEQFAKWWKDLSGEEMSEAIKSSPAVRDAFRRMDKEAADKVRAENEQAKESTPQPAPRPENAFQDYIMQTGGHQGDPAVMAQDLLQKRGHQWAFSPAGLDEIGRTATEVKHIQKDLALVYGSLHPELGQIRPSEIWQHITPDDMQKLEQIPRAKAMLDRIQSEATQRMTEAQQELGEKQSIQDEKDIIAAQVSAQKQVEAVAKAQQKEVEAQAKQAEKDAQAAATATEKKKGSLRRAEKKAPTTTSKPADEAVTPPESVTPPAVLPVAGGDVAEKPEQPNLFRTGPTAETAMRRPLGQGSYDWQEYGDMMRRSAQKEAEKTAGVTPKEQKKFAIETIDDALKGPFVHEGGEPFVEFHIPGDGDFKIRNEAPILEKMQKRFKTGVAIATGKQSIPSTRPTGTRNALDKIEDLEYFTPTYHPKKGEWNAAPDNSFYKDGFFTNGHYAIEMKDPGGWSRKPTKDNLRDFVNSKSKGAIPGNIVGEYKGLGYGSESLSVVVVEANGPHAFAARYMDIIYGQHPKAKLFVNPELGIAVFKEGKKPVALIMGMQMPGEYLNRINKFISEAKPKVEPAAKKGLGEEKRPPGTLRRLSAPGRKFTPSGNEEVDNAVDKVLNVLAPRMGVNLAPPTFSGKQIEINPLTPEGAGAAREHGISEEDIQDAAAKGETFEVLGEHNFFPGGKEKQARSQIVVHVGATPRDVFHEFVHAADAQGKLTGWTGTSEERAGYLEDILTRGEEDKIIEFGQPRTGKLSKGKLYSIRRKTAPLHIVTPNPETTGIKHATVEQEMADRGLPPYMKGLPKSEKAMLANGKRLVDSGQIDPRFLASQLAAKPRAHSDEEVAALLYDRMRLQNDHAAVMDQIEKAKDDKVVSIEARQRLAKIEDDISTNDLATWRSGSETGRGLAARKMMIAQDYSLPRSLQRIRVATGLKELPVELREKIEKLTRQLQEAIAKSGVYEEKIKQLEAERKVRKTAREIPAAQRKAAERGEHRQDIKANIRSLAEKINTKLYHLNMTFDPEVIALLGKMAKSYVELGVLDAKEVVSSVYQELQGLTPNPDMTERDIRDAISGYGRVNKLTKNEIEVDLRRTKRELRLISALEDAQAGIKPPHQGVVLEPPSERVRNLAKQVKTILREKGIDGGDARALKAYKTRLTNQIPELEKMLATGNFEKKARRVLKMDPEANRLKANVEHLKEKIDDEIYKQKMANRSKLVKALDWSFKWRRAVILSGSATLGKLTAAATMRQISTPIEEVVGSALRVLPYLKPIFAMAPREGAGLNVRAEAAAFAQWFKKQTYSDIVTSITKGTTELDLLYGKKKSHMPPTMLDFFWHVHMALKVTPKRAEFFRSLQQRTEWAMSQGMDMSEPANVMGITAAAYADANRAIFMNDNMVTDLYRRLIAGLKQQGPTGHIVATGLQFLMPIVKVPTNFAGEVISYTAGTLPAAMRLYRTGGLKGLTPEDADYIARNLKKQGLGLFFLLLGMASAASIGGYYQRGEKRTGKDVKPGDIRVVGVDIPHLFLHHPVVMGPLAIGATLMRVMGQFEKYNRTHPPDMSKGKGIREGVEAGAWGAAKGVPFIDAPLRMATAAESPEGREKFGAQLLESLVTPPDVRRIARRMDKAGEEQIPREQKTLGQILQGSVPGQRSKLPLNIGTIQRMTVDRIAELVEKAPPGTIQGNDARAVYKTFHAKVKAEWKELTPEERTKYQDLQKKLVEDMKAEPAQPTDKKRTKIWQRQNQAGKGFSILNEGAAK